MNTLTHQCLRTWACILLFSLVANHLSAQQLSGRELLDRSIAFHDPEGKWGRVSATLVIDQETPNRSTRPSKVLIDNKNGVFELNTIRGGHHIFLKVDASDSCHYSVDWRSNISRSQADSLGLNNDRIRRNRDYHNYLYGLPMKLKDKGTQLADEVTEGFFMGKKVLSLRVTYDQSVGSDIWYFYFDPGTYALTGYRFYHDEAKGDGEYIVCTGMSIQNGLRIPKDRAWYTNQGDRLLGTDILVSMNIRE